MDDTFAVDGRTRGPWVSWSTFWRGGLLALAVVFVISTQLLFQAGLYEAWPLADILAGWWEYFLEQAAVAAQ